MVLWYLFKFSKMSLSFLNFNFTRILPALFEAICYALYKGRGVCIDFLMHVNNESLWRVLFMGGVKHVS